MRTAHHSRMAGLTERAHYITDLQRPSNTMSRQQASTYGPESGEGGRGSGDGQYLQRAGQQSGERTRHSGENSHKGYPFQGSPHHGDEGAARRRHERRTELSMKKRGSVVSDALYARRAHCRETLGRDTSSREGRGQQVCT
jgi:hypothetical protein